MKVDGMKADGSMPDPGRYRVALAGYYGFGNFGDELLAEAAIAALSRCGVGRREIVLLSGAPEETSRRFGVEAVNRWDLLKVARALRRSDTLLLGGGGLFQDASSRRSCLYYWGLVRLACFCGAVPGALGQSVGPLSGAMGRWMTRDALRRCRVVQVRDEVSRGLCNDLGVSVETGCDPAFSLGEFFSFRPSSSSVSGPRKILINLRPCAGKLPERFARALAERLSESQGREEPVGLALSDEDAGVMTALIERKILPPMPLERIDRGADALRLWRNASEAWGMRLHFAVLSSLMGAPMGVAPYDPKVQSFADRYGVPVWREGKLPKPRPAVGTPPPDAARWEIDAICRSLLTPDF